MQLQLCFSTLRSQSGAPVLTGLSGGRQAGVCRKLAGAIAFGLLLLAALGGAVPLAGQVTPPSAAFPGDWTWMNGSNSVDPSGHYGTLGAPAGLANFPGSRWGATSWVDNNGNLWLFAGFGYGDAATFGYLNDLWEFDPSTSYWTWMGGDTTFNANYCGDAPTYGPLGSFGTGYFPGGRESAASWTDKSGNLWLFGGQGDGAGPPGSGGACGGAFTFGYLNDLWEFNPSTPNSATGTNGEWAWMGGSSAPNASGMYPAAMYEYTSGVAPGARYEASTWTDNSGNFWLFGGEGYDANGNFGELNDLWQFNPSLNEWAWMGGSSAVPSYSGQPGVYGTMGTPAAGNIPGGRYGASTWTDSSGNLWLFGGDGFDGVGSSGDLNDLWEFNRSVGEYGEWAWMGGSSAISGGGWPGVYGTQGTPSAGNIPGGRYQAVSWTDSSGHFWLFGGAGIGTTAGTGGVSTGLLYDLWAFDPSTSQWVWVNGSSTLNQPGFYSALYTPASGNIPGGRGQATSWTDMDGNLWLFGGDGRGPGSSVGALNDIWVYPPPAISFGGSPAAAIPIFSVPSGTYTTAQTVAISDATPGATIYYTTDGTTPTTGSSVFSSSNPITVSSTETLEAIATATGHSTSQVGTAVYSILPQAATPTFSPPAGPITSGQTVTISDATPGASIYYTTCTTAGCTPTTPTQGSTSYSGPITVSPPETIEAIAIAYGYVTSAVGTAAYTIGSSGPAMVTDNETITVSDAEVFPDVVDSEPITVTDMVSVTTSLIITTTGSLPAGNVGVPYPATTFAASGGSGTGYTWSVSGQPSGLSMSTAGVLSGTPTAAGTFSVAVKVTDSAGKTASATFSLTVSASLAITGPASLPAGIVGVSYPATTIAASGGSGVYTWTAAGLPSGLTIGATTGTITGTPGPNTAGTDSVTVTVIDSASHMASMNYSLTVIPPPSLTVSASPVTLTIVQGQTGETTITLTPQGGYSGTLTLTCSGLPANTSCVFKPSTPVVFTGMNDQPVTVMLTIDTDVDAMATVQPASVPTPLRPGAILTAIAFWCPGSLLGVIALRRKRRLFTKNPRSFGLCLCVLLVGAMAGLAGCISGGGFGTYVTPVGTSTVTVVVTPSSGSAQTLNIGVTITQQ
jgi:hypothetical protein